MQSLSRSSGFPFPLCSAVPSVVRVFLSRSKKLCNPLSFVSFVVKAFPDV